VIIGRRDVGGNSRQMRWPGDRGEILRRTHVGAAEHPDLPVRIRKHSRPLHRVVTVLRFVLERIPFSLRCVSPPNVLCDDHIPAGRRLQANISVPSLVIWRACQQHRKLAVRLWPANICAQDDAITHLRLYISLDDHFVTVGRTYSGRSQDRQGDEATGWQPPGTPCGSICSLAQQRSCHAFHLSWVAETAGRFAA
jgi:hypothetical protein